MSSRRRFLEGYAWQGVEATRYKENGPHFRDVSRQVLFGDAAGISSELRYFEIGPGGHTTLERHAHPHAVVALRGRGRALVGGEVVALRPYDLLDVPPWSWHQLRANEEEPFGFLCLVDRDRDRPRHPSEAELEELCRDPEVAAFVRT